MKRVVIVGGGFGGLAAAKGLSHLPAVDVTLINRFETMHFKPLLPDIISRSIPIRHMVYPIEAYRHAYGFRFVLDEVSRIELEQGLVTAKKETIPYDYLIMATGSETNFYGNDPLKEKALKLDDVYDGDRIAYAVSRGGYDTFVVCGGGYTGVEVATHIRKHLQVHHQNKSVTIVEMADSILGPVPDWMKAYTRNNLANWNIDILLETRVNGIENREVTLSDGNTFKNALLIWSAGMKAPGIVDRLDTPKESQGRISTDAFLRFSENAYAVGNTGCYPSQGNCPRMAAQMAVRQGSHAAENILRSMRGQGLAAFKPVDYGFFIPMANWNSCGTFLGKKVSGSLATFLHYFVSAYRLAGAANKLNVMRHALMSKSR
ncbi:MAG: FAD-dependent oxidoreductase [Desulfobacterales bacterium]